MIRTQFKKLLRKVALSATKNNPYLTKLIKEMVYESRKRISDSEELIALKNFNEQLSDEQARKFSPINRAMPVHLTLETTMDCNLCCIMCPVHSSKEAKERAKITGAHMPFELFEKIAKETFPTLKEINLTVSGEPLMNPDLPKMLEILKRYSVRLDLITNGTLLKDDLIDMLVKNLSNLHISFDGASKETFEKIRKNANFDLVLSNIKKFNQARKGMGRAEQPRLLFDVILMKSNIRELPDLISLAHSLEVDYVNCAHVQIFEEKFKVESLLYHKQLANQFLLEADKRARKLGVRLTLPKLFKLDSVVENDHSQEETIEETHPTESRLRSCDMLWRRAYISYNGDVSPCCVHRRPVVGNILQQSLEEIWNNQTYQDIRRRLNSDNPFECCKHCTLYFQMNEPDDNDASLIFYEA